MDKVATKRAFVQHSVPTADYMVVEQEDDRQWVRAAAGRLGYPLVCKPASGGSSLGVSLVHNDGELDDGLAHATEAACNIGQPEVHGPGAVIIERYIRGREFTVGVIDGQPLPVVEICSGREFFDYEAKYTDENTRYVIPCAVLETLYRKMQESALNACRALDCRHLARVDMIYGYDGELYVLEANTIPGFTRRSLLPKAADYAGMEFGQLCENICAMALRDASIQEDNRQSA
jgi:D-alanine-D-alanine ligase